MSELLDSLSSIVGEKHIQIAESDLSQFNKGTFKHTNFSVACISPGNLSELRSVISEVNDNNENFPADAVQIHPISSGKNWGYTSTEPSQDGSLLLSLGRFTCISEYDEKQGTVTIEAGVTQQQLYDYLQDKGGLFWLDATGSSPDCSIVGNTVERGFGHTLYADHFDYVCGMEVLLPTGEVIHTGFKQFSRANHIANAENCSKWGVGPYIDGIFSQSHLGIVTKLTLWLMPKPENYLTFFIGIKNEDQFTQLVDCLQPLKLKDVLKSAVHIANSDKAIQAVSFYPYELTLGETPLSDPIKQLLRKKYMLNAWSVSGAFYGSKGEIKDWKKQLKKAVRPVSGKVVFVDSKFLAFLKYTKNILTKLTGIDFISNVNLLEEMFHLKQGKPTFYFLKSTLWRKPDVPEDKFIKHPPKYNAGLLWIAPIAPIDGEHAKILRDLAYEVITKYGFEPGLSITLLTRRSLECIISIVFDRDIEGEDEKALKCHDELVKKLVLKGYYPYRMSSPLQQNYEGYFNSDLLTTIKKIKKTLDPNSVMASGKYGI